MIGINSWQIAINFRTVLRMASRLNYTIVIVKLADCKKEIITAVTTSGNATTILTFI